MCLAIFFLENLIDMAKQRYCIKFFQKLSDAQMETIQKIQRYLAMWPLAQSRQSNGVTL